MPTVRELRATAHASLTKVRTLNEEYTQKYGAGYLKNDQLPADCRQAITEASASWKRDHDALKQAENAQTSETQAILDSMNGVNLGTTTQDPPPRSRGQGRNRGGRQGNRRQHRTDGRPSRRGITWKPNGSSHARTIRYQSENHQAQHEVLMAELLPHHPDARAAAEQYENYNVLVDEIDAKGGFFTVSERLMAGILKNVDDDVFMMRKARQIILPDAKTLSTIIRTAKASSFAFTNSLTDITERMENALKYGKKSWSPHQIMGAFWIHRDLMENATVSPVQLMTEEMMIDYDEMLEDVLLYGSGIATSINAAGQTVSHFCPIGVMYPSPTGGAGITTARDITNGTTTTAFTGDTFIRAKYNLKKRYRSRAEFLLHRDVIAATATLKDTTGAYIWRQGLTGDDPDRLVGRPVEESEWMPNTPGASNYFGILGDFSWYWVVIGQRMEIMRLDEIAARQGLIEYHFRSKLDGGPAKEEAFVRLKYAAV